jgi:predicted nucleic acid-binding Zn ribbon protein
MDRLEKEIRRVAKRVGLPAASELVRAWPQIVGETIAQNAWPARLNSKGVLQVNTSSATWAFELKHLAPQILAKLEEELRALIARAAAASLAQGGRKDAP